MSSAEATARKFYEDYQIGTLADDVQRYLIILMLSNKSSEADAFDEANNHYSESVSKVEIPPKYTTEELHSRIAQAEKDILSNNTTLAVEMESRLEEKYPWLCK